MRVLILLLALLLPAAPAAAATALLLDIDGPIGPATRDYFDHGLDKARAEGAELVIVRIDTPGGLADSMREMVMHLLGSPVPVVFFVAPDGARAASAGTYLLYAAHVAAMAPATHLGAATPIALGGLPGATEKGKDDALERKLTNDAAAYIRMLAKLRGRNADWAEKAVREGASIDAEEALRLHVIDLIAPDLPRLLAALDGREVKAGDRTVRLATQNLEVVEFAPDWRTRLLAAITNPNVAYLLLLLGIYGLVMEFAHPGAVLPGVTGAVALMLALFALQLLPVSYAGLLLILLGVALMVAEAFVPSFGALGVGGISAFVVGSLMLFDESAPGFALDPWLVAAVAAGSVLLLTFVIGYVLKARRRPVVSGAEELVGMEAIARDNFVSEGWVHVHGELWRARSRTPVRNGERLRVTALRGLTLEVEPISEEGDDHG